MRRSLLYGLFPVVRAEMLRLLLTNPRQELYVRQLARESFLALHTVQDELEKLRAARLVLQRSNGFRHYYRANLKHPLHSILRNLVIKSGPIEKPSIPATRHRKRRGARPARMAPVMRSRTPGPFFLSK